MFSALVVATKSSGVQYFEPNPAGGGSWSAYTQDNMPPVVKSKLSVVPQVLGRLMTAAPSTWWPLVQFKATETKNL